MEPHVMVHKANSIAQYFAAYPHEEAVAGVADHLQKFWEPRMRRQLHAYLAGGGAGLHDLVREAATRLQPPPGAEA
jgi:formate dehydrogenase subunit delta